MLTPIYQYHINGPSRFLFSSNPDIQSGWTKDGIAFHAYQNQEPGTIAYYQYHQDEEGPYRVLYTTAADLDGKRDIGNALITMDGLAFYVYPHPQPGTVPFYRYLATDPFRPLFSTDPNIQSGWQFEGVEFYAVPPNLDWKYQYDNLIYEEVISPPTRKDLIQSNVISNPGQGSTVTETVSLTRQLTSSFEWGLSETLELQEKLTFTVGAPEVATSSTESGITIALGSTETWSDSKEIEYGASEQVTVEAGHSKNVSGFVDWADDLTVPFALVIRVSAQAGTVPLTGAQVRDLFLTLNKSRTPTIKTVEDQSIVVSLRGAFKGSYGLRTELVVTDL